MAETEATSGRPKVSAVELAGGSLAAVSAGVIASTMGVEGTIVGTAVGSVVATVGGAWYSWSLGRTQDRLRTSAQTIVASARTKTETGRSVRAETTATQAAADASTAAAAASRNVDASPADGDRQPAAGYEEVSGTESAPSRRPPWRKLAIGAIGAFLIAIAAITVFELATGQPLAATVQGEQGDGASLLGGEEQIEPGPPAPSVAPTTSSPTPTRDAPPEPASPAVPTPTPAETLTGGPTSTPAPTAEAPSTPAQPTATAPPETPGT
jgi:hypothetical protein